MIFSNLVLLNFEEYQKHLLKSWILLDIQMIIIHTYWIGVGKISLPYALMTVFFCTNFRLVKLKNFLQD